MYTIWADNVCIYDDTVPAVQNVSYDPWSVDANLSVYEEKSVYINSNGKWSSTGSIRSKFIKIVDLAQTLTLVGGSTAYYTFLTADTYAIGGTPRYAAGYSNRVPYSGTITVDVPAGAKFVWIYTHTSSTDITPSKVTFSGVHMRVSEAVNVIQPKLTLNAGAAGSLTFNAPPNSLAYSPSVVNRLTTTLKVKRDGKEIWRGRVMSEKEDFYKNRELTCEGALAFLNDTVVSPTMSVSDGKITITSDTIAANDPYTILGNLLSSHNLQVASERRIYLGTVPQDKRVSGTVREIKVNFEKTLDVINSKIVGELGGIIDVRYEEVSETTETVGLYLYYYADYPKSANQRIIFSENLIDFARNWDVKDFVTAIFPKGARIEQEATEGSSERPEEYVSIAGLTAVSPSLTVDGAILKNPTAIQNYGFILGYQDFNDIENASDLLSESEKFLLQKQFSDMEIELTALDLHILNPEIEAFDLLDVVNVSSPPHGMINQLFSVIGEDIPLDLPENTKYTMGDSTVAYKRRIRTLTQRNRQTAQDLNGRVDDANDRIDDTNDYVDETAGRLTTNLNNEISARETGDSNTLTQARQDIADYMGSISEGYVFIDHTATTTQGIYITSQPVTQYSELAQCRWYWGWNSQGLAHFSYGQQTGVALTSDGKINADMILTGKLLVDYVRLYNELAVYDGTGVYAGIGGYMGYGAGFDGTSVTYGIRMHTTAGEMIVTNSGARMSCGNVGFFVNDTYGSINATLYASDFQATSDRNAKKNIEYDPEKYRLLFDALRPCSFEYKTDNTGTRHTGFIAQDVEDVLAESGLTLEDFGCISKRTVVDPKTQEKHIEYSLGYNEFISLCVDQIHMLKQRVTDLEAKING